MNFYRDTRATVDLDHLLYNIDVIYKKSQKPLMAVLKANAYGHGDQAVASVLENHLAIAMYGLATIKEAIDLRIAGMKKEMLVIGPTRWEDAKYAAIYNVALTAYSMD
ncbi:MAG: alanine racemase, partial [Beduini sp.]